MAHEVLISQYDRSSAVPLHLRSSDHHRMSFFKKLNKSCPRPLHSVLWTPSHTGVVPLGITADLEPEVGSEGELRSMESRNRRGL